MKLKEAKEILGKIMAWQFFMMGADKKPENIDYSLEDMLKANKLVEKANERNKKYAEKRLKETGKSHTRRIYMTCADRLIAAVYVAMNWDASDEAVVLCNDKLVGIVKAKYS